MAKQFNFSNIDELKNYAETMNTTIPENISKILSREKFNDNYKIYGEEMQIVDITNPKEIIYSPEFIYLDYKPNIIKIECNARITGNIKYQIKYGIK